jgi:hypothetical protein
MKSEVYKWKVDTRDELLARILDAAVRIKKREDRLRRTTCELQSSLRLTVGFSNIYFKSKIFFISVQQICHLNIKLKLN